LKDPKGHDLKCKSESNLLEDSIFEFIDFQKSQSTSWFEIDEPENRFSSLVQKRAENPRFSAFRCSVHKKWPHHGWDNGTSLLGLLDHFSGGERNKEGEEKDGGYRGVGAVKLGVVSHLLPRLSSGRPLSIPTARARRLY